MRNSLTNNQRVQNGVIHFPDIIFLKKVTKALNNTHPMPLPQIREVVMDMGNNSLSCDGKSISLK